MDLQIICRECYIERSQASTRLVTVTLNDVEDTDELIGELNNYDLLENIKEAVRDIGYEEGYEEGCKEGYDQGYEEGHNAIK